MTLSNTLRNQQAFRDFTHTDGWNAPFAVTLTMKQGMMVEGPYGKTFVKLTRAEASQNLRHFLTLLNKHVFGKAYSRFGVRIPVIPVLEGGSKSRLHFHLMIDCPKDNLIETYPQIIDCLWSRTQWGHSQTNIQADADSGWINYISKTRDKPSFEDSIDWENYTILD